MYAAALVMPRFEDVTRRLEACFDGRGRNRSILPPAADPSGAACQRAETGRRSKRIRSTVPPPHSDRREAGQTARGCR